MMSEKEILARLEAKIDRIERKLTELLGDKRKTTWVKVGTVVDLTGWTPEKLRQMRDNGIVKWKKTDTGVWYLLESINPLFLKGM